MILHYESPRSPTGKDWTDESLLSNLNIDNYLAESNAFQRTSFTSIIERWKEHERNKANQLISSFDSRYNMKARFRNDDQLNRTSELKHASLAKYYRFIGNENNPKNSKPCGIHKRHVQEYNERHLRESLRLPTLTKTRSQPYFLPNRTKLPSIESSSIVISSEFDETSRHTFS